MSVLSGLNNTSIHRLKYSKEEIPKRSMEIFEQVANTSLILPPYTLPSYSNFGFALLGNVLGIIAANQSSSYSSNSSLISFQIFVEQNILVPLGLTNTGFNYTSEVQQQMAQGVTSPGKTLPCCYSLYWNTPAGGMYSTVRDLLTLLQFLISNTSNNQVLSYSSRREHLLPMFIDASGVTGFGMPWELYIVNGSLITAKGGSIPGFGSSAFVQSGLGYSVVMLASGSPNGIVFPPLFANFLNFAFEQFVTTSQPPIPTPSNASLYTGIYSSAEAITLEISQDNGGPLQIASYKGATFAYLSWLGHNKFAFNVIASEFTCFLEELYAFQGEQVLFKFDGAPGSHATSFQDPGILYYFTRD